MIKFRNNIRKAIAEKILTSLDHGGINKIFRKGTLKMRWLVESAASRIEIAIRPNTSGLVIPSRAIPSHHLLALDIIIIHLDDTSEADDAGCFSSPLTSCSVFCSNGGGFLDRPDLEVQFSAHLAKYANNL